MDKKSSKKEETQNSPIKKSSYSHSQSMENVKKIEQNFKKMTDNKKRLIDER